MMADELDKQIIRALIERPMTIAEITTIAMEIHNSAEKSKARAMVNYRLGLMMEDGFVARDRKTKTFSLENCTFGVGKIEHDTENGKHKVIDMGKVVLIKDREVVFLDIE